MTRNILILLAGLYASSMPNAPKMTTFPGRIHNVASPNREFILTNIARDQEPYYVLVLKRNGVIRDEQILSYDRQIDVMWAPDSRLFFVNNWALSNESDCLVVSPKSGDKQSVLRALKRSSAKLAYHLGTLDHLYVSCDAWLPNNGVLVSVVGHNPGTFNETFIVHEPSGRVDVAPPGIKVELPPELKP